MAEIHQVLWSLAVQARMQQLNIMTLSL